MLPFYRNQRQRVYNPWGPDPYVNAFQHLQRTIPGIAAQYARYPQIQAIGTSIASAATSRIMGSDKRNRDGSSKGDVGGDAQGPGQCSVEDGTINNYPRDYEVVRINSKGARWIQRYMDTRDLFSRLMWPRNLFQTIQDESAILVVGSAAIATVKEIYSFLGGELLMLPKVGSSIAQGTAGVASGLQQGGLAQGQGVAIDAVSIDPNAETYIETPVLTARHRIRNTSSRAAHIVIYEFLAKGDHCSDYTTTAFNPKGLWEAYGDTQEASSANSLTLASTAITAALPGTWTAANTTNVSVMPFTKPKGYGANWTLVNTTKAQLKPGKQLIYTYQSDKQRIKIKALQDRVAQNGQTAIIAGYTKVIMIKAIGERTTSTLTPFNYGWTSCQLSVDSEKQYVTSIAWAARTKYMFATEAADTARGTAYYNSIPLGQQAGTATGVGDPIAAYTAALN